MLSPSTWRLRSNRTRGETPMNGKVLRRMDQQGRLRARWVIGTVVACGWAIIAALAFVNSVADSPLKPRQRARTNIMTVLPEGWSFFTRDPREPRTLLYRHSGTGWEHVSQRHADRANYFGFARLARVKMVETAALLDQVSPGQWTQVAAGTDPLGMEVQVVKASNPAMSPLLCGELLVIERPPAPWAWSTSKAPVRMAGRAVRLSAACRPATPQVTATGTPQGSEP